MTYDNKQNIAKITVIVIVVVLGKVMYVDLSDQKVYTVTGTSPIRRFGYCTLINNTSYIIYCIYYFCDTLVK